MYKTDCILFDPTIPTKCRGLKVCKCEGCMFYKTEEMEKESARKCIERLDFYNGHKQVR